MDLCRAVEEACRVVQENPNAGGAAQEYLMNFKNREQPYEDCKFILENSTLPYAQFWAASTIQDASIREWARNNATERSSLRQFLLQFLVYKFSSVPPFVREKVMHALAVVVKCGWFDSQEGNDEVLNQVKQLFASQDNTTKEIGVLLLSSLICEFSITHSRSVGLTWEYHNRCRKNFETYCLKNAFGLVLGFTQSEATAILQSAGGNDGDLRRLVKHCLELIVHILSWQFCEHESERAVMSMISKTTDSTFVRPGAEWRDVFLNQEFLALFFNMYIPFRQDETIAHLVRQVMIQLASVTGKVFHNDGERVVYLSHIIGSVRKVLAAVLSSLQADEAIGISEMIYRLCSNFGIHVLLRCQDAGLFMEDFARLSCSFMDLFVGTLDPTDSDSIQEAVDLLFEGWSALAAHVVDSHDNDAVRAELEKYTGLVYRKYVEGTISRCIALINHGIDEDDEDEEKTTLDDRMVTLSVVARVSPAGPCAFLNSMLVETTSAVQQRLSGGASIEAPLQEQLLWLVKFSGYLIADEGKGERPMIPTSLALLYAQAKPSSDHTAMALAAQNNSQVHPVIPMTQAIMNIVDIDTQCVSNRVSGLSPAVVESLMWFLARHAGSYLLIEPSDYTCGSEGRPLSMTLLSAFSNTSADALGMSDSLLRKILFNLIHHRREPSIIEETCELLSQMTKPKMIRRALVTQPAWSDLINAFATNKDGMVTMSTPGIMQRTVLSMCYGVCGSPSPEKCAESLASILRVVGERLSSIQSISLDPQDPKVMAHVEVALEMMRGVLCSTETYSQPIIWQFISQYMSLVVQLMNAYRLRPEVVDMILKTLCDVVDSQLTYLSSADSNVVYTTCMECLKVYAASTAGVAKEFGARALKEQSKEEESERLYTITRLLSSVLSKDFFDLQDDASRDPNMTHVADVVFFGLKLLLPLFDKDMIEFQELSKLFFDLVGFMVEVYPEKLTGLPQELVGDLMRTVEFGIHHTMGDSAMSCLQAVIGLANHFIKMKSQDPSGLIKHFLSVVVNQVIFENFDIYILDTFADALLATILAEKESFHHLAQQLISSQSNASTQSRLTSAFTVLCSDIADGMALTRPAKVAFRKKCKAFLAEVRAFLRTKCI